MSIWLVLLIIEIIIESIATDMIPIAQKHLINSITAYSPDIYIFLMYFFIVQFGYYGSQSFKSYIQIRLSQYYRNKNSKEYINTSTDIGYEDITLYSHNRVSNYNQRVQEDIKLSYHNRIVVYTEYSISLIMTVGLICMMSSNLKLLMSGLIYAGLSLLVLVIFSKYMIKAEIIVQTAEADFREKLSLKNLFIVDKNIRQAALIRLGYNTFAKTQAAITLIVPFIILLPDYMMKSMTIGDLLSSCTMFSLLVVNIDIIISLFQTMTQGIASRNRVREIKG